MQSIKPHNIVPYVTGVQKIFLTILLFDSAVYTATEKNKCLNLLCACINVTYHFFHRKMNII